jgi:diguanylate cyclase (GGDEF)-like protein
MLGREIARIIMEKIWEFYENMNELVYVSDMDTHEIIYMNRKARELYHIDTVEDFQGRPCYEILQGASQPCSFCTNNDLTPGHFVEWTHYNPSVSRPYSLKDTMVMDGDRRCRIELAIDMTVQEHQREIILEYVNNEAMLNEALRVSLTSSAPEESIYLLLDYLGKSLQCDRVYIFEEAPREFLNNTYEWCAPGIIPQKDNLQHIPRVHAAIWLERFQKDHGVIIKDLNDIKYADPIMYDYLLPQDIHSLVTSPLQDGDRIIGFFGVDNPPARMLENISTLFQIMGHFIFSLLRRRDLVKRLESLSYFDQLTGCRNRHALEEYRTTLQPDQSLGVLYGDVTGLKHINDTVSHQAGDALLIRTSQCLQRVFPHDPVFRVGGDEFLVLCSGITQEGLEESVEALRAETAANDVVLAFGYLWQPDSTGDMDQLFHQVDQQMYHNKRAYYANLERDRRRPSPPHSD